MCEKTNETQLLEKIKLKLSLNEYQMKLLDDEYTICALRGLWDNNQIYTFYKCHMCNCLCLNGNGDFCAGCS